MTKTNKELLRFLVAGMLAVSTDFVSYMFLYNHLSVDLAKGVSFILGSVVAFFVNRMWTFENDSHIAIAMMQFSILYFATFLANVGVNHLALVWLPGAKGLAFLAATATSTILNFLGMKFWVFSTKASTKGLF